MIPTQVEVLTGIYGAWRLARLDRGGMSFFDNSTGGFIKSFFAAAIVAPAFIIMMLIFLRGEAQIEAGLIRAVVVLAIAYVLSWTVFPVMMHQICVNIGKDDRFIGYIVAINWARVLQTGVLLLVTLITETGLLGSGASSFLNTAVYMLILAYFWFISRTALDVGGFAATGVVLLDVIIGGIIRAIAFGMLK